MSTVDTTEGTAGVQLACAVCDDPITTSACDDQVLCGECSLHHCSDCYLAYAETLGDRFLTRWSA